MRHAKLLAVGFMLLFLVVYAVRMPNPVPFASAALSGTQQIYGCVILSSTLLRIVSSPSSCTPVLETAISWRQQPATGTEFPFMCGGCNLSGINGLDGVNLTGAWLRNASLTSADFHSATMTNANLKAADLTDADFTGAYLVDANLSDATMSGSEFDSVNFTGASLTNMSIADTTFSGSIGMTTSSLSGSYFSNVVCPDGTNSDSHSSNCDGHLTP
jgi:uncharacterized protein YjbI with pentapeptide repeats